MDCSWKCITTLARRFPDGSNALPLDQLEGLLKRLIAIDRVVRPWLERA